MLVKYKITKEYASEKVGIHIPDYGHVALDADNLTDNMAEASQKAGSPFFELVETAKAATTVKAIQA